MEPESEEGRGLEVGIGGAASTEMSIKPLDPEVTRKISTQQVIPGLPEACRELIDNALDAGGKVIEVRTYRGGYARLEVIDNGEGVKPNDRDKLCKPHCTSKLRSMEELKSLTTFGFRGEALNSLASLGKVTITTRCASDPRATQMVFDEHGSIITQKLTAGNAGTIVCVENLFEGMPVRRQELLNNIKYEYHKLTRVVQTFAFGHPDVRFRLGDTPEGKPRKEIFTTPGGTQTTLRDRLAKVITRVFGSVKEVGELLEMKELLPKDEIALHYKLERTVGSEVEIYNAIKFSGYVSSCTANGKPAKDRQFFYVNKREVDYPKLSRIANQIYKTWRQDNPPLLILFIELDPADLDVNVTPDKRKLLYKYESQLFAKFHASLLHTLRSAEGAPVSVSVTPSILPVAGVKEQSPEREGLLPKKRVRTEQCEASSNAYDEEDEDVFVDTASTAYDPGSPTFTESSDTSLFQELGEECDRPRGAKRAIKVKKKSGAFAGKMGERGFNKSSTTRLIVPTGNTSMAEPSIVPASTLPLRQHQVGAARLGEVRIRQAVKPTVMQPPQTHSVEDLVEQAEGWMRLRELQLQGEHDLDRELNELLGREDDDEGEEGGPTPSHSEQIEAYQLDDDDEGTGGQSSDDSEIGNGGDDGDNPLRPCELLEMDFDQLERDFHALYADSSGGDAVASSAMNYVTFSYLEPSQDLLMARNSGGTEDGKHCYEEGDEEAVPLDDRGLQQLSTMLKAEDFKRMTVVGQFNQSLILVRHANDELFLIDQHAADEKFLFEKYQREKELEPQKCTNPQPLFLGALREQLLRDNLPAMEINGFKFEFDESAEVGAQAKMTHTPGGEFTVDDVENIISALEDQTATGTTTSDGCTIYRPTKLRDLLAMEACRNAVMFNHVIDEAKMRSIVDNMGTMNQPWGRPGATFQNCPHGRPTIRHIGTIRRETVPMDDAGRIMVQKKEENNDGAADATADGDEKENLQLGI